MTDKKLPHFTFQVIVLLLLFIAVGVWLWWVLRDIGPYAWVQNRINGWRSPAVR